MNKLIILDRDGVINQDSDAYVKSPDEFVLLPGSAAAIARLYQAGYRITIATNQSGLARGYFSVETLEAMHQKLEQAVTAAGGRIELIRHCPHGPDDHCDCRKPRPGLIHQIEQALNISAKDAWLVGDSLRDLQAGQACGCQVALVRTGKGERTLEKGEGLDQVAVFADLAAFADHLLHKEDARV